MGRIGVFAAIALTLSGCASSSVSSALRSPSPSPSPTPICSGAACLTKPSGWHALLLPTDAIQDPTRINGKLLNNDWDTYLIGVIELRDLYRSAMHADGWVYDSANSSLDHGSGAYAWADIFCRPGPAPVVVATVIVGEIHSNDSEAATARRAQITFLDLDNEGTCP